MKFTHAMLEMEIRELRAERDAARDEADWWRQKVDGAPGYQDVLVKPAPFLRRYQEWWDHRMGDQ